MPRVCIGKNPGWFALARQRGVSIRQSPDEPERQEDVEVHSEGAERCYTPGIKYVQLLLLYAAWCLVTLARDAISKGLSKESGWVRSPLV